MGDLQEVKKKKTETVKKDCNPQFQQSFSFKVEEKDLETTAVKVVGFNRLAFPEKGKIFRQLVLKCANFAAFPIMFQIRPSATPS